MKTRDRIAVGLAGLIVPPLFRAAYSTLKFETSGESNLERWKAGEAVVFVTWHGRLLPLLYLFRDRHIVMLVSQHRDGEYLTRLGRSLGYDAVRGSSTRGGYGALRELARKIRGGQSLAITPDGPQGPKEKLKPGALQVARITGAPVVPVMAGGDRAWWVEGWDRFMVPKPLGTIRVAVGSASFVPREISVRGLEDRAQELEEQLRTLKRQVDPQTISSRPR